MKRNLFLSLCLIAVSAVFAQEVDKKHVTAAADQAQSAAAALKAVDTGEQAWKFDGSLGLNAAATGLVNWAAGGKNNVNGIAYVKLHLLYHKDAIAWETNFDTDFGMTWIDQDEDALQKSSDNIKLATKFGWEFKKNWYLTALAGFQSQYALGRDYVTGYNNPISKWLAPSYTDISVGIDWKKSYKGADFSVYLSPIAGRISTAYVSEAWNKKYTEEMALSSYQTAIDNATTDAERAAAQLIYDGVKELYGNGGYEALVETQKDFRSTLQEKYGTYAYNKETGAKDLRDFRAELGLSFKGAIAYTYKDFKVSTTLALFTPYQGKGYNLKDMYEVKNGVGSWELRDKNENYFEWSSNNRYFGHFDVDWDVAMSYQFLKCLQVTLQTSLKYYPGTLISNHEGIQSERVQFKGVIGVGVGYSF